MLPKHIKRVVAIDFETFFDSKNGYSLKRAMTIEEYVRDPRFEVICLTATEDGKTVYEAWGKDEARALLTRLGVDRKDTLTVAHNARFEGVIMEQRLDIHTNMLVCSMHLMRISGVSRLCRESLAALADYLRKCGYPLPEKGHETDNADGLRLSQMTPEFRLSYMAYCRTDTIIEYMAAIILLEMCPVQSLYGSDLTLQMYTRPVIEIDKPLLENYLDALIKRRQETLQKMAVDYGYSTVPDFLDVLRSKNKLAALLKSLNVEIPLKLSVKQTETKRIKMADPKEVAKKDTKKFRQQLAEQGKTFEQWVNEPVMDYAFAMKDPEFIALADHPDIRVQAIINARLENNSSQAESRTRRFLACAQRGAMVFALQYAKARTHRYTADDALNQQNLPKHTGDKTLRKSMRAPKGMLIGGADSSQVEARCLAYAAQEKQLLTIFETGGDPYSYMAEVIYNVPAADIKRWAKMDDKDIPADKKEYQTLLSFMRFMGKKTVLGSGYQMSGDKFALTLKSEGIQLKPAKEDIKYWLGTQRKEVIQNKKELSLRFNQFCKDFHLSEAKRINYIYRRQHQQIVLFWQICDWVLSKLCQGDSGYFGGPDGDLFFFDGKHQILGETVPGIMLPNGEWLVYPDLFTYRDEETGFIKYAFYEVKGNTRITKQIYGGSLTENLIQGLAFTILTWQAIRIHQLVPVKGNVHDEWISIFPEKQLQKVQYIYTTVMKTTPPWIPNLPLNCEFKAGQCYGDM